MRKAFTLIELLVIIAIIVVILGVVGDLFFLVEIVFYVFFGWIIGAWRLISGLRHEPTAVCVGVGALVLLPLMLHGLVRSVLPGSACGCGCSGTDSEKFQWKFRQSISVAGIFCSFIATTIALIACIHEFYWLSHSGKAILNSSGRTVARDMQSMNNLKHFSLGAREFADKNESQTLPSGGFLLEDGRPGHGWLTQLLPYLDENATYEELDLKKPWNDPANASVYKDKKRIQWIRFSKYRLEPEPDGYIRTNYAANERVMPLGRSLSLPDITDGTSNTILFGEAVENPQPWGSPFNGRDPALGLNRSPYGFGYEKPYHSANFALCDGSVHRISEDVAPEILRAMATPNGGETIKYP